ncbi:MAG: PAS domain-containing protein, partial [Bacteroidota bacterium]
SIATQLATAQDLASMGSYEVDLLSSKIQVSDNFLAILGRSGQELTLDQILALIHPKDLADIIARYNQGVENHQSFNYACRAVHEDGHYLYLEVKNQIQYTPDGQPMRVMGVIQDVTLQREAEKALRASEERLRHLTDNMEEVFWLRSADNQEILYISPAYDKIWGRDHRELYKNPSSFLEAIHPEDLPKVLALGDSYQERGSYEFEHRIVLPDGEIKWVWARQTAVYDESGQVVSQTGFATDITERKQREGRINLLQNVVEKARDGILITEVMPDSPDPLDLQVIYANQAFYELTGYSSHEVLNRGLGQVQGLSSDLPDMNRVRRAINAWESVDLEVQTKRKDGSTFWSSWVFSPIADEKGNYTNWLSIQRDVTARKSAEL